MWDQGNRGLLHAVIAFAGFLILGAILAVSWLGTLGFAVAGFTALLYLMGHALGAGELHWWMGERTDGKRDALRAQLAKQRFAHTDAEDFDEEAWARARGRSRRD